MLFNNRIAALTLLCTLFQQYGYEWENIMKYLNIMKRMCLQLQCDILGHSDLMYEGPKKNLRPPQKFLLFQKTTSRASSLLKTKKTNTPKLFYSNYKKESLTELG